MTSDIKKGVVLRLFGRSGCRPCTIIQHVLAAEQDRLIAEDVTLITHDIGEEVELIEQYDLSSVPVMVFERNGMEMARINGLCNITEIFDAIAEAKEAK